MCGVESRLLLIKRLVGWFQVAGLVTLLEGDDPTSPSNSSLAAAVLHAQAQAAVLGSSISEQAVALAVAGPSSRATWLQELNAPASGLDLILSGTKLNSAAARVSASRLAVRERRESVRAVQALQPRAHATCANESESAASRMVRPLAL